MSKTNQRSIHWLKRWFSPALFAAVAFGTPLQASAYDVTIDPLAQTVTLGQQVSVNVTVADVLPGGVGSYDFTLDFDAAILDYNGFVDGAGLGFAIGLSPFDNGNSLVLADFSLEAVADLLALQSPSFTLFTLVFDAIGVGTSDLGFSRQELADASGAIVAFGLTGASVTVLQAGGGGGGNGVPEPATWALAAVAMLGSAVVRRRVYRTR